MRKLLFCAAMTLCAATANAQRAENSQCAASQTEFQDACEKGIDLFDYMLPQLGNAMAGGNPTLGQGGALGGIGHFQVGLRVTGVFGSLPEFTSSSAPSINGPVRSTFETKSTIVPMPALDLTVGLFKGLPLGVTNFGGVDLIVSAAYVPEIDGDQVSIAVDGSSLKLGFGGRIGLIQESLLVPGISVSYLKRGLPKMNITAEVPDANPDTIFVRGFELNASSWRIVANKKLLIVGLGAGVGQDTYDAETELAVVVNDVCPIIGTCRFPGSGEQTLFSHDNKITRTNYFLNASLNFLVLKLVAEVGQVSGGKIPTYNTFDKKADASRTYASVGLRVGL